MCECAYNCMQALNGRTWHGKGQRQGQGVCLCAQAIDGQVVGMGHVLINIEGELLAKT